MSVESKARFVAGTISPMGQDRRPMPNPEPLLPPEVRRIASSLEIGEYTPEGVDEAIKSHYWACVDQLIAQGANSITIAGLPISSQLGRPRVRALLEETSRRTGAIADSHAEATIAALQHLGARRIAIASRWSSALNEKLVAYLGQGGIEVLAITARGQWAKQASMMSIESGVKLAFELSREVMRKAPQAQALLLGGGAWRSLAAVPILEEDFSVPVITNPITEAWRVIAAGYAPPVKGWGRLLAGG
jgi:arylmalonate decarboxylase